MRKQIDFTKLFYEHFKGRHQKITYEVRYYPHRYHDLVFLNGLVHDSRFRIDAITQKGKYLKMQIERDCWEIEPKKAEDIGSRTELFVVNSILTISPVYKVEWIVDNPSKYLPDKELWLQYIWIERTSIDENGIGQIIISGDGWKCSLKVMDSELRMRLLDIEVPFLYSERSMV